MEYHDKVLKCSECNREFVFTAGEQMFFADKGFKNEPKRCKECKAKRAQGTGSGSGNVQRVGNQNDLLAVRKRNYGSFQPDAGTARVLPRMFPAAAVDRATEHRGAVTRAFLKRLEASRAKFPAIQAPEALARSEGGAGGGPVRREIHLQRLFSACKRWEEPFDFLVVEARTARCDRLAAFAERAGTISRRAARKASVSGCVPMVTRRKLGMAAKRRPTNMLRARNCSMIGFTSVPISSITKLACEGMNGRDSLASAAQSHCARAIELRAAGGYALVVREAGESCLQHGGVAVVLAEAVRRGGR